MAKLSDSSKEAKEIEKISDKIFATASLFAKASEQISFLASAGENSNKNEDFCRAISNKTELNETKTKEDLKFLKTN